MGYEVSIQRREEKISQEEWATYVYNDKEFSNSTLKKIDTDVSVWNSYLGEVPFLYDENSGSISVKNPNDFILKKMVSISKKIDAIVIGEEGEVYE